jgi:hypothetical protein
MGHNSNTFWHVAIGATYYPKAPGSGLATVTCLHDSPSGCTEWSVTGSSQEATLQRIANNGTVTSLGNFFVSFSFNVKE